MNSIDKSLEVAYQTTSYKFTSKGRTATIRIGQVCVELEDLCHEHAVTSWAVITAYNPFSRPLPASANQHRQQLLQSLLSIAKFEFFEGEGIGESGDWPPEPSFLVLGIDQEKALAYGTVFDQNAIVYGNSGSVAQLLFCASR
ncbi:MAG: DUF3293 domain-containing protein [Granulosicoccus sp.]